MPTKGLRLFLLSVMITLAGGCDNVAFGGIQVELRPPSGGTDESIPDTDELPPAETGSLPLELGPILYLVETLGDSRAAILPIAELGPDGYRPLPDLPNLVERFPLQRLESGEEFNLFLQGVRVGTFVADGTVEADLAACLVRPRAGGRVEVRPEAAAGRRFLAMAKDEFATDPSRPFPAIVEDFALRNGSVEAVQRVIRETGATWPTSIPGIRQDIQVLALDGEGSPGLAASFVYDGSLVVGPASERAYGIFIVAREGAEEYEPVVAWYQRGGAGAKAFPRLLGAHDVRRTGSPDLILEVFGDETRWFSVLGTSTGEWGVVYQDPCASAGTPETLRVFP